ncbi:hypothetical protein AO385_1385 [Moraxella catarrhalis]|uniref:Uncharacterized protein n=1 Tax=Moraxella catarrhalis TaxID=480 RepID=A0A198UHT5_MORCA|nr:hypothetical protein AO383_2141 [Moraxella catarrhalis]OAU94797.1 hypothetical protein AO384_2154 [Moraxella catarrhalis]OAU99602.1 hypothetical protein AO385_1385 [Moraxella catarrhalis]
MAFDDCMDNLATDENFFQINLASLLRYGTLVKKKFSL